MGYTHDGSKWVSVADGTTPISFDDSTPAGSTYEKSIPVLKSLGYIDDESNPVLNAAHDAATVHLGAPWRMMTDEELMKLTNTTYCACEWTENYRETGVKGYIITGVQELFRNNKIFIPAAGRGSVNGFKYGGERGRYWSASVKLGSMQGSVLDTSSWAYDFSKDPEESDLQPNNRYLGFTIRPVRDAAE